jgi:hypothetical protein
VLFDTVGPVTATVGSRDDLADDWLNTAAVRTLPGHDSTKPFPKRSELRRAEARAAGRRGADRRPPGSRPPNGGAGSHRPPAPVVSGRGAEPTRRPHQGGPTAPWMPIAVAPTAAVLPIRQTSTQTRPAGIDLRLPPPNSADAFFPPAPGGAPLPLAVPAYDGVLAPPPAPSELAAPVVPSFDPAEWGLDIDAAPATGRRRGQDDTAPGVRRPSSAPTAPLATRLLGRGKAGAARLLVLALVVGAEGVAVSSMAGHARTAPVDPSTAGINGAYQLAALSPATLPSATVLKDSAAEQRSAAEAQQAALALSQAQDESSKAKVTAALQQAKAAADRIKAAADRRARAMRNAQRDPRSVGRIMAADRGWGTAQFNCLNLLWNRESMWNYRASNPTSSAYGIPQALAAPGGAPGSKMASAGADWRTNPVTQIKWGLDYIADRYGTPCGAWGHSQSTGWY